MPFLAFLLVVLELAFLLVADLLLVDADSKKGFGEPIMPESAERT